MGIILCIFVVGGLGIFFQKLLEPFFMSANLSRRIGNELGRVLIVDKFNLKAMLNH